MAAAWPAGRRPAGPQGPARRAKPSTAARRRLSESSRKPAVVTTRSPAASPSSTAVLPCSDQPALTSRGSKRPPPRSTKTYCWSPVSTRASDGITTASAAPSSSVTSPYMPGRSSSEGFASSMRACSVRLPALRAGVDELDPAGEAPPGVGPAPRRWPAGRPGRGGARPRRSSTSTQTVERSASWKSSVPAWHVEPAHRALAGHVAAHRGPQRHRLERLAGGGQGVDVLGRPGRAAPASAATPRSRSPPTGGCWVPPGSAGPTSAGRSGRPAGR